MAEFKDLSEVRRRRVAGPTEERGAVAIHDRCREPDRSERPSGVTFGSPASAEGTEVVFLDAGTTALCVADLAGEVPEVRFVTTGPDNARRLGERGHRHFCLIGGRYLPVKDSRVGSLAIAGPHSLRFDIALPCRSAVNADRGSAGIGDESHARIRKEAIAASNSIQALADRRKFDTHPFIRTAPFSALDGVITTARTGEKNAALMRSAGTKVALA